MRFNGTLRRTLTGWALIAAAACGGEPAADGDDPDQFEGSGRVADCGVPAGDVQIRDGVGVLRPGVAVAQLRLRCAVVRDTVAPGPEGMPVRLIVIALGADSAVAEVVDDSVWRVRLTSPRYRIAEGFGVGTPARQVAAAPGASVHVGEGEVYVLLDGSCGVSFRIAGADFGRVAAARSAAQALAELPDSARIDRVLLWRCAAGGGA